MSTTIRDAIQAALEDCSVLTPDIEVAEKVAASYRTLAAYRDATMPLVADEVRRLRRRDDRAIQWPTTTQRMREGVAVSPAEERSRWLSMRLLVPGRPPVTFGAATVADHEARIAYLEGLRSGIATTIAVHEDAIRRIREAGVSCLLDLEEEAA